MLQALLSGGDSEGHSFREQKDMLAPCSTWARGSRVRVSRVPALSVNNSKMTLGKHTAWEYDSAFRELEKQEDIKYGTEANTLCVLDK